MPTTTLVHRDAFCATVRDTDVFICTYPKSGTTWLAFLIAHVLKGESGEALNLKSVDQYVPDVNRNYTKNIPLEAFDHLGDPRVFRCHAEYDPKLPKAIYILRDPRDVMVSYWHYQKFLNKDFNLSLRDYLESGTRWPCDWDEHVEGWLLSPEPTKRIIVRYEDLHEDAADVLRSVLAFSGMEASEKQITAAVEASRFERMRAAEEKFGVHGKQGDQNERFVRKGKVGGWREEITPEALEILETKFEKAMNLAGYSRPGKNQGTRAGFSSH